MRIISWNVNGIRAVERKGDLKECIETQRPDIMFFQETKANADQLKEIIETYDEYAQWYHSAEKKGYSGTAVWIRKELKEKIPVSIHTGMPEWEDTEGRIIRIDRGNFSYLGIYFPNGGKSQEAWEGKMEFYVVFLRYINRLRKEGRNVVWCGDVNCAHEEIDIARPKENQNSIGFLPEERAWISRVIEEGWDDVFRTRYPEKKEVYSWWHVITRSRAKNIGWRIDYFFVDTQLQKQIQHIEYLSDQMGSDHCPLLLEIQTDK